jgi:lysozyme
MITENGLNLIKHFESCKLNSYQDTAGVWTIGWGHTKNVTRKTIINQETADRFLIDDLKNAEKKVDEFVKIDLKQCERDSLISSAYNLRSFPKLAGYLKQDRQLYLEKLVQYCCDIKGNSLLGLKRRRYAEKYLFQGITWNNILPMLKEIV